MKRYKALNESEFHRMMTEATMEIVKRVLQEVAGPDALPAGDYDYPEDEDFYPEEENYDDPDYLGEGYYPRYY